MLYSKNWIGGEWSVPEGGEIEVFNPSNVQEKVGIIRLSGVRDVLRAADAAREAQREWARLTGAQRGEALYRMAEALAANLDEIAELASREMGKPISEMKGEVMRGVNLLKYYAAEGVRQIGSIIPASTPDVLQYSLRVPLGVVGVITPWNFPVAIPIWKIAPALICGNAVVWKPAELASLTATRMAEIFADCGLVPGVLNLVVGKGSQIGDALLEQAGLDAVSFTGSTPTGQRVALACAGRNIKYQTEMGGKNAAVVLKDADLDLAVQAIVSGAFRSAGQKCTATSRIIVERGILEPFSAKLKAAVESLHVAQALDPDAYLGPVASHQQFMQVMKYVEMARNEAKVTAVRSGIPGGGHFVAPMVVTDVGVDHPLAQEEIFGPLAVILEADDFDHAVDLCNRTVFGLSASVFTRDLSRALKFLEEAQAGLVRVNQETAGVEYQAPFGGMKWSGSHSREQGQAALDFFSQIKTCAVNYM